MCFREAHCVIVPADAHIMGSIRRSSCVYGDIPSVAGSAQNHCSSRASNAAGCIWYPYHLGGSSDVSTCQ
jgi:hypothetical protein